MKCFSGKIMFCEQKEALFKKYVGMWTKQKME